MEDSLLGSDPAQALTAIARRLRLPFDSDDLAGRVADHAAPRSLLALVEVAQTVGLSAQAFHADWDDLAGVATPAVVHLQGENDASFVLLLERGPDEVVLEVPATRKRVRVDRERFTALWSGVIAVLARSTAPVPVPEASPGLLRTGAPLARPRLAGLAGLGLLALLAAARLGIDASSVTIGVAAAAVCALIFTAAGVSAVLVLASRRSRAPSATPALVSKICGRGSLFDCEGVLGSKFSHVFGIELSVAGLAVFGGASALAATAGVLPGEARAALASWIAWVLAAAVPGVLLLVGVQVWPLRRFCPLCLTVHACVLAAAGLASPMLGRASIGDLVPWALLHGVAALGTAGLLVPFLEGVLEIRTHRSRLAWIGATPWGAMAEVTGRPPVPDWGLADTAVLGPPTARFRADVLVHPTCGGCPPLLESLEEMRRRRPRDMRVVLQFPPRDPARTEDRELCAALAAIGRVHGGPAALEAFLAAKKTVWKLLETSRTGGARAVLSVLSPDLLLDEALLRDSRDAVARADRALADLKRGTPTLLIQGKPWDAPLEDFEALLAGHPDLLAAALGVPAAVEEHA